MLNWSCSLGFFMQIKNEHYIEDVFWNLRWQLLPLWHFFLQNSRTVVYVGMEGLSLVVYVGKEGLSLVVYVGMEGLNLVVYVGMEGLSLVVYVGMEGLSLVVYVGMEGLSLDGAIKNVDI